MNPFISLHAVVPRIPDVTFAVPFTFSMNKGDVWTFYGENGSGKTLLSEIICGKYGLSAGSIEYPFMDEERAKTTQFIYPRQFIKTIHFQSTYSFSDFRDAYYQQRFNVYEVDWYPTVEDVLRQDAVDEGWWQQVVSVFRLFNLLSHRIITLSSGQLRRLLMAKALLEKPRMMIFDNPFIGLDANTRNLLKDLLERLTQTTNLTVILVLSKYDDIPEFITHVLPVKDMRLLPKQTREDFIHGITTFNTSLPHELAEWIRNLPQKDISTISFYPQNGGEILRFNNVCIRYGNRTILKDICWNVNEGERWALQGQNGAGKSTLLSLVCADNPQSYSCDIHLFGHKRGTGESIWQIKRHIGYVSPEMHRAYLRDLPAIDIVASGLSDSVGLYCRPRPEQREVCRQWMRVFGIAGIQDKTFLKLSSGEQRLCLLARAFVKDPELLILDEPLHGLDLKNRQRVREIIKLFCQRPHKTIIMVTHYQEELPDCVTHRMELKKNL